VYININVVPVLADTCSHLQGVHTKVMFSEEYVTLCKVKVNCTLQSKLQYLRMQEAIMHEIYNIKYT
jgi:hypothetical protein